MRAAVITDGELRIESRETPSPSGSDVLVRVESAGINAADLLQRRGFYPAPAGAPADIPGMELAGIVTKIGPDVEGVSLGQRVCAIVGGGAQSTHCVVASEHLLTVPDELDMIEAGGLAEAFCTAHDALFTQGQLQSGERVLISGAAGGVGTAAVQLVAAAGAIAIAVVRERTHAHSLLDLGASEVVTIEEVEDLDPVDVVLELVGAAHLEHAQRVLAPRSRVVIIGVGGGGRMEIDLLGMMTRRSVLTGSTLRARSRLEKSAVTDAVRRDVLPLFSSGRLRVPIAGTYLLDDIEGAYDAFATPGKFGKIVVTTL